MTMATKDEVAAFIAAEFPQAKVVIEAVGDRGATVSHEIGPSELRPGGTVSGPVLMTVADVALYVAILGEIGIVPLTGITLPLLSFGGTSMIFIAGALGLVFQLSRYTTHDVVELKEGQDESSSSRRRIRRTRYAGGRSFTRA